MENPTAYWISPNVAQVVFDRPQRLDGDPPLPYGCGQFDAFQLPSSNVAPFVATSED